MNINHKEGTPDETLANILGEILASVERLFQWILDGYLPSHDLNALFLDRWETAFGLTAAKTTAERINNITAAIRLLGKTATEQQIRTIFAPVFNTTSDRVRITFATLQDIETAGPQTNWQHDFLVFHYHVYCIDETGEVDRVLGDTIVDRFEPAGYWLTYGPYNIAKYDQSYGYDYSVYGE
jgi:uncharacterized protein YmfQ (DUF2313 family)